MNPRTKRQLLDLLKEFDELAMHAPNLEYGPSIFQVAHDPLLHDEGKACQHCRGGEIVGELRALIEKEPSVIVADRQGGTTASDWPLGVRYRP